MATADQITAFDNAIAKMKGDADTAALSQGSLDKSTQALAVAQADVESKKTAATTDIATLQADLDAVNAAGAALGLKVNATPSMTVSPPTA